VDREAGGTQAILEAGHALTVLYTAAELLDAAGQPRGS
jgi:hypothetical protein